MPVEDQDIQVRQHRQEEAPVRSPQRGDNIRYPLRGQDDDNASRRPEVCAGGRSLATPTRVVSGTFTSILKPQLTPIVDNTNEDNNQVAEDEKAGNPPRPLPSIRGIVPVAMPARLGSTIPTRIPSALRSQHIIGGTNGPANNDPPSVAASFRSRGTGNSSVIAYPRGITPSTIQGKKTVRLSVLPVNENRTVNYGVEDFETANINVANRATSFAPKRLLDIENGTSIVVTDENFLNGRRFAELGKDGAIIVSARAIAPIAREDSLFFEEHRRALQDKINAGDVHDLSSINEVDVLGGAWRGVLRRLMVWSYDEITGLRMGRQLQLFLPFQTGYESYVLAQLIEALDSGITSEVRFILKIALKNRNVSRIIVQNLSPRWDFLWHWHGQVTWNRLYDGWGQFPVVGITAFPATENFPSTRDHALASMFRSILGPGAWLTRVFTQGREGLVTDNPNNTAQNLAAESNGFELANRNQYGTYVGRRKTNEFRFAHRLPTDESIVRTFVAQAMPTMINNGVVHTLRQLANHWHNMLNQFSGNFAHQRMEQLDPFETMRFHMPVVLVVLSSLRGRNKWDAEVLGPFIRRCQELKPAMNADTCRNLVDHMQDNIVVNVCAGIASVVDPLRSWLDAIKQACYGIEEEAKVVYEDVSSVEIGIRLGYDLITKVNWSLPSDKVLKNAILGHIRGAPPVPDIGVYQVQNALNLTTPRDKRTLIELVNNNLTRTAPAQLLLGRVKTLLQRELRRTRLDEALREISIGDVVAETPKHDEWYWLEEGDKRSVYIYDAKKTGQDMHRFIHADSGIERFVSLSKEVLTIRAYVPVAEAISRAQRCFMNIELDHGIRFKYNAFMEFNFLRMALRNLIVVSQICCEELDNARLNLLREVQRSNQVQVSIHDLAVGKTYYTYNGKTKEFEPFQCEKAYTPSDPEWSKLARARIVKIPPQSITVVGGGPTGLMTVVHCTESCLASGGIMKLYEARDAFSKAGATFERAQIVRLDARWIAMLRYHLGTGFEDVYIPASGETDSQLGNTLPTQGFVEITIKDLENMLHIEVSRLWSKGVIQCFTESKAKYDLVSNSLVKQGEALKEEDLIVRRVDPNGSRTNKQHTWKVKELIKIKPLHLDDLKIGQEYGVYLRLENAIIPFKLTGIDLEYNSYKFKSQREGVENLETYAENLPSIYPKGTTRHGETSKVLVESIVKGDSGGYVQEELAMKVIKKEKFTIDIGHTHVVECIGKPHGSNVHFSTTTYEPYGVCCIQGLKISMGMHNFGNKRWGQGIVDDIRSHTDQNTRIVGDFTKMVRQAPIAKLMHQYMKSDNWKTHFEKLIEDSDFPELTSLDPIIPKLEVATKVHADAAPGFHRKTLQTRFFETGDNYYLGMEFTREYDRWKKETVEELVAPLSLKSKGGESKKKLERFKGVLNHHIDRLWYEACLETIRQGDVYNPGAKHRVPRLYMINSYFDTRLDTLPVGESFRLSDHPEEKYEVVIKKATQIIVRNVEGYISYMKRNTVVKREGNLTRGPDGNSESRVALATFPVGHYVNHRTLRLSNEVKGYVFAFIGDEQSTPHFMRYSGLTGACINSMLFNNFVKGALNGVSFIDRFALYSKETNWSNGEVVKRGTGANYGLDGFLRPGFAYDHGLEYLHSKVIEWIETQQDLDHILTPDWLNRFAAALVPRGMELNDDFIRCLRQQNQKHIFNKFMKEIKADKLIKSDDLHEALMMRHKAMENDREDLTYNEYWEKFLMGLKGINNSTKMRLQNYHIEIAKRLEQTIEQIIETASEEYLYSKRISSELSNQPKPVDSIVDDFAVEAQNFANSLTMSAAFSSGALAFTLINIRGTDSRLGIIWAAIIGGLNILLSFGTMTNSSRYKIRNEEARVLFFEEKFLNVKKAVFSLMDRKDQDTTPDTYNPFIIDLDNRIETFLKKAEYYDMEDPKELKENYSALKANINDPDAIRSFQQKLSTHFIPDVYHVNSYLQEYLVNIFKVLEDMHYLLTRQAERKSSNGNAERFFTRLTVFTLTLKNSLQDGHVRFGFLKKRSIFNWDFAVVFKYFYSLICCARSRGRTPFAPIQTETLGLVRNARQLSKQNGHKILRREIRDLEHLYWATRESDIASLIFVSGFLVFIASIVFSISRIITRANGPDTVTDVAFWATVASATGAILATNHFVRKLGLLIGLWFSLGKKVRKAQSMDYKRNLRKVKGVTFTQILLTLVRLGSATASAVALPWSVAQFGFDDNVGLAESIPFWIALGAICSAILATIFFFIVEYVVRYHLSPRLGEYICEAFRDEIEDMYKILEVPLNDIDTKQVQERETWEYVAREFLHKYRFDTVFAADRFGSILQYIQSGMDSRS